MVQRQNRRPTNGRVCRLASHSGIDTMRGCSVHKIENGYARLPSTRSRPTTSRALLTTT